MTGADGTLVRQVLSGDEDAFEALVERHKGAVYALVVGKTGNFASAEDLVQETFVEAYLHLKSLKDPGKFPAWVRGIAVNLSNKWIQKRKPDVPIDNLDRSEEAALQSEILPETFVRLPQAPDSLYEVEEMRNRVLGAVEALSEKHREAVLLHYMEGMTYREIAGLLEVPETTVLGRLQVARSQLREELLPVVEETLKAQRPTSELTRKVMAALPPLLLLTPDSKWLGLKRFFGGSQFWKVAGVLTGAVVGTAIYFSGIVAIINWNSDMDAGSKSGASASPMTLDISEDHAATPVERPEQTAVALQQRETTGKTDRPVKSTDPRRVTQRVKGSTNDPSKPTLRLSHSPTDSVVTITYTIPDSTFRDSVHVDLKVYNLSGTTAALPVNQMQAVGEHTVLLEKRTLSDGMYFVVLTLNRSRMHTDRKRLNLYWEGRR